jgi:acetyl-CoA C-acetyltransferase
MAKSNLAIIGVGEVPTGIYPERTRWDILYNVCTEAVRAAGLTMKDIEGVITVAPQAQPRITSEISFGKIPEELGMTNVRDVCICNAGGASTTNCLRLAEHYIENGLAKIVLIPHVTVHSTIPVQDVISFFATAGQDTQWEYPYGSSFNGILGMVAQRYMYETGTTAQEMAATVVALRKWAALDPNSMFFKKPLTLEDVLSSKMVSTPLHSRECNVLADGGGAMVVTSAHLAREISDTPVYKLGHGARYLGACNILRKDFFMREGWRAATKDALDQAGLTIDDMDILEFYMAYPFNQLIGLEAVGITQPGESGRFVMEGHTSPGGKCPVSTIGDAAGRGHTGSGVSMANYIETVRQLMGKAGDRQVPDCRFVLASAAGGSGMNTLMTVFGREIP